VIYAYRIADFDGTRDWYNLVGLALALDWPGFSVGFDDLGDDEMREDFVRTTLVTAAGALALVSKDESRIGDLMALLMCAEVYELA
jgi:hypothetical protein